MVAITNGAKEEAFGGMVKSMSTGPPKQKNVHRTDVRLQELPCCQLLWRASNVFAETPLR
jgi:hypothetical protein